MLPSRAITLTRGGSRSPTVGLEKAKDEVGCHRNSADQVQDNNEMGEPKLERISIISLRTQVRLALVCIVRREGEIDGLHERSGSHGIALALQSSAQSV